MAWWDDLGSLSRAAAEWLNRTSAAGAGALNQGGERIIPGSTPPGAPGAPPPPTPPAPPAAAPPPAAAAPEAAAAPPPAPATPGREQTTLERFQGQLNDVEQAIAAAETAIRKDPNSSEAYNAQQALPALRTLRTSITSQIAAEENRLRDEKKAKEAEEAKPKNGDTRQTLREWTDPQGRKITGMVTETYNNGVWSYVPGSATAATGIPAGPGQSGTVLTDGQGAYWMVDPITGKATAINGPAAGVKTINDPDGSVWTQKPDGSKGTKLFDSLPGTYTTSDGRVIGYDRRTGQQVFNIDTQTPEGRALADRLQRATVEAAEQANQPKFGSAIAQYQSEASRRQSMAREELQRLTELQKSGQISPDQAEAQFDRWMQLNVEGPLAGYRAAAEEERRTQEQNNLTRQRAEEARVEGLNRERDRLAYQAGEEGRREAIELGRRTRAPEYIRDLGQFAQSLQAGPQGGPNAAAPFKFSSEAFDPANFRKAVPNVNELADAAVNRLLSRIQPATARDVNVPVPALPSGADLRGLMDGVRYSGPLSGTPAGETPLPGQEAIDLGTGRARTVYSNGRYVDWDINAPAIAQAAAPVGALAAAGNSDTAGYGTGDDASAEGLPGALPGETVGQRRRRFYGQ